MDKYPLLKKLIKKEQKTNENLRKTTLKKIFALLDELAVKYGFKEAYIFGSITQKYMFNLGSDIDIAIDRMSEPRRFFELITEFEKALKKRVDLYLLEDIKFLNKNSAILWKKNI